MGGYPSVLFYKGNGTTRNFTHPTYNSELSSLEVYVDDVLIAETEYTMAGGGAVWFNTAPANNTAVKIQRVTDNTERAVEFTNASMRLATAFNDDSDQLMALIQELADARKNAAVIDGTLTALWDADGRVLTNLGYPSADTDAATVGYVDDILADMSAPLVHSVLQDGTGLEWDYDVGAGTITPVLDLSAFSTTNLPEGTNLYWTTTRGKALMDSVITAGTGITKSFVDPTMTLSVNMGAFTTSDLAEGTNLYWTVARGKAMLDDYLHAGAGLSISSGGGYRIINFTPDTVFTYGTGLTRTGVSPYTNLSVNMGAFTTSDLAEGGNYYYTTARTKADVLAYLAAGTGITLTSGATLGISQTASSVLQLTNVKVDDEVIGNRSTLNFISSTGATLSGADTGSEVTITVANDGEPMEVDHDGSELGTFQIVDYRDNTAEGFKWTFSTAVAGRLIATLKACTEWEYGDVDGGEGASPSYTDEPLDGNTDSYTAMFDGGNEIP